MAASSQTPTPGLASDLPTAKANDSSIDQALTLLLADETEAALRWGAAALQRDPSTSSALVVTSRLLEKMGRTRAAIEGLHAAVRRALEAGNLPLAIAAIDELRALGENVGELFDKVSAAFCQESPRLDETSAALSPHFDDFQPLSSYLAGPALASKAAQIVQAATQPDANEPTPSDALPSVARLPLFSALPQDALRDLLAAFDVITVPAGYSVMEEGELGTAAYIVARGEIVLRRASGTKPPVVLARLGSGAFFGEMALLSDMPRSASAVTTRPSILLVATREALDAVARRHPIVAIELAAHCHRRLVANLGHMAPILGALPPADRAVIVEKFVTRIFRKGDRLATKGEEIGGLHLLASGAVAVVAYEGDERVVLATLSAGETIGEVELVLCRRANADVIALQPTVTLFLSREDFASLVLDHPALVHGLYVTAVRRDGETAQALESAAFTTNDYQLDDVAVEEPLVAEETRLDADAFRETEAPPVAAVETPATPPPAVLSAPPALHVVPAAEEEPARVASITAPFPPVVATVPSAPMAAEAPARVAASVPPVPPVAPATPVAPPPAPHHVTPATIVARVGAPGPAKVPASAAASTPPAPFSARAALEEPPKSIRSSRFSTMSPLMASKPPSAPAASSRKRGPWELPPVAVIGALAAVALIGFALAAPLGNHLNTAAASGGAVIPTDVPAPEPASEPAPETAAVVAAPTAPPAVQPAAPPVVPLPAVAPATMAASPAPRPRAIAPTHARPAPSTPAIESSAASAAPTASALAATASAARPEPKSTRAAAGSDEFGGRE
jgi:cAMP-dependent protein kinase regulator